MRRISPTHFRIARRGTSREINRQIALNLVRAKQPVSRADLARLMGVRRGAVTRLVDELLEAGLVFEGAKGESRRGRKPTHLHIETRRRCALAVDISASRTLMLVTDPLGHPLRRSRSSRPGRDRRSWSVGLEAAAPDPGDGASALLAWLADLIGRAQAAGALDARARPAGIVLVDTIDAHLHPSRQRQILGHLARRFPAPQIVATAQSPEAVVNRAPGEVAVCRRHGAARAVTQELPALVGRNADEILRGPWFGLAATVDDQTAALLARYRERVRAGAGEDERARLREAVRERVGYFVATPLDELVTEVLAALASEQRGPPGAPRQALVQAAVLALRPRLEEHET